MSSNVYFYRSRVPHIYVWLRHSQTGSILRRKLPRITVKNCTFRNRRNVYKRRIYSVKLAVFLGMDLLHLANRRETFFGFISHRVRQDETWRDETRSLIVSYHRGMPRLVRGVTLV